MSDEMPALDEDGLWQADRAFLEAQMRGLTPAKCVRAAIIAYVEATQEE